MCTYCQCLINCNAQKKNTGSTIRFCNLAPSVEITYMLVAKEPRSFGKHKTYHIILQEVRKDLLAATVQIHVVIDKNEHFLSVQYTFAPTFGRGQGVESNYLKDVHHKYQ